MDFTTGFFYLFSAVLLFAAFRVITARNPVYAALYLVLTFAQAAAVWLLLKAEFLAIALVLVYVGAVMVLFLFVVMMLDVNFDSLRQNFRSYVPVGALVGALVLIEMALVIVSSAIGTQEALPPLPSGSNTQALGKLIYVDYVYPFEIAAVVLLVAIIAAIALTLRKRKDSRAQDPSEQVRARREERDVCRERSQQGSLPRAGVLACPMAGAGRQPGAGQSLRPGRVGLLPRAGLLCLSSVESTAEQCRRPPRRRGSRPTGAIWRAGPSSCPER